MKKDRNHRLRAACTRIRHFYLVNSARCRDTRASLSAPSSADDEIYDIAYEETERRESTYTGRIHTTFERMLLASSIS